MLKAYLYILQMLMVWPTWHTFHYKIKYLYNIEQPTPVPTDGLVAKFQPRHYHHGPPVYPLGAALSTDTAPAGSPQQCILYTGH